MKWIINLEPQHTVVEKITERSWSSGPANHSHIVPVPTQTEIRNNLWVMYSGR